ncbi:NAD(P)H-dependent oxidoreductase [Fictibacillus fluitans]|uniref:NAD(P)H-dependent oxidoreductase n=1 Tax=Fictibacillus fluitans TaxID=3058422 RepID=A0ABT8HSL4_9BACL|nr:NAD(P)H-dependent oxidoreductase [Fictibacillus sp. NE201]MDN4523748.1 NAD(P)H-dependent oxidoreductase [Fictibacillus sp. NE201]
MMNHLLLFCHPSSHSFNHALLEVYSKELEKSGHSVDVRNLYDLDFQPVLTESEYKNSLEFRYEADVLKEQEYIAWCDRLALIYPVWWGGMPALLKGYIDRVFSYGFAYELDGEEPVPRLQGKSAVTICTTGTPSEIYDENGMHDAMDTARNVSIFEFCGIKATHSLYFGNVILAGDEKRRNMLEEVRQLAVSGPKPY